jgi:hypothetical protein
MYSLIKSTLLVAALCFGTLGNGFTQTTPPVNSAYWVVETNVKQQTFSIVRIYNHQHELIYQERIEGVCLDISKRRHKRILDQTLASFTEQRIIARQLGKARRF